MPVDLSVEDAEEKLQAAIDAAAAAECDDDDDDDDDNIPAKRQRTDATVLRRCTATEPDNMNKVISLLYYHLSVSHGV